MNEILLFNMCMDMCMEMGWFTFRIGYIFINVAYGTVYYPLLYLKSYGIPKKEP